MKGAGDKWTWRRSSSGESCLFSVKNRVKNESKVKVGNVELSSHERSHVGNVPLGSMRVIKNNNNCFRQQWIPGWSWPHAVTTKLILTKE